MRTRTIHRMLAVATIAAASTVAVAPAATARPAAPACSLGWNSLGKAHAGHTRGQIFGHVAYAEACSDRFIVQIRGRVTGYYVRYASEIDYAGTTIAMPLRGEAFLHLQVASRMVRGVASIGADLAPVAGYTTFRQVRYAGSGAGLTHYGIGVRSNLPFRVNLIHGAVNSYLVVDVAHDW